MKGWDEADISLEMALVRAAKRGDAEFVRSALKAGAETVVVDLDPQASATRHLGLDPDQAEVTVTDVLIEPSAGLARAVVPTR